MDNLDSMINEPHIVSFNNVLGIDFVVEIKVYSIAYDI